jgi:hypothetical protein
MAWSETMAVVPKASGAPQAKVDTGSGAQGLRKELNSKQSRRHTLRTQSLNIPAFPF